MGDASDSVLEVTGYMNFEVQGGMSEHPSVETSCVGNLELSSGRRDSNTNLNVTHITLRSAWYFGNVCSSHVGSYSIVPFDIDILYLQTALEFKEAGTFS